MPVPRRPLAPLHRPWAPALLGLLALAGCGADEPAPHALGDGASSQTAQVARASPAASEGAAEAGPGAFEAARDHAFALRAADEDAEVVRAALLAAHALDPRAYGVNRLLGETYLALGQPEEALHHQRLALAERPDDVGVAVVVLELLVRVGRDEEAEALLPLLLSNEAAAGRALAVQAALLDARGERDLALATLRRAEQLPLEDSAGARLLLGRFLLQDGDYEGARACFGAALRVTPDSAEAVKGLADACHRSNRADEARHWDEVLGLLLVLTDNEYIAKDLQQQEQALTRLIEIHPSWGHAFRRLAAVLRRLGEHERACAVIERYLREHEREVDAAERTRLRERYCG